MLIVHVHASVKPGLLKQFLAATVVNAQASLGSAVFPAGSESWKTSSP
jgi:hypothetical protein